MKFMNGMNIETSMMPCKYHTGKGPAKDKRQRAYKRRGRKAELWNRPFIAWDSEGINLAGDTKPQRTVLWGCSVEPDTPLLITENQDGLTFEQMADYTLGIAEQYPRHFHVGYFLQYDQNMLIRTLPPRKKQALYENGKIRHKVGNITYRIAWIPGKRIRLSRTIGEKKVSITIDDFAHFFSTSFVKAYKSMFHNYEQDSLFQKVAYGKENLRQGTTFSDLPNILEYWQAEIVLVARLAESFRSAMYDANMLLNEWYGPGALANYLMRERQMDIHLQKKEDAPNEIHEASKRAYFGGHVEQYKAGRIKGPIYTIDIRSAYPYALSYAPSLGAQNGNWKRIEGISKARDIQRPFGIYRIRFHHPQSKAWEWLPQPLPHRDIKGNISFPQHLEGWYMSPETIAVLSTFPNDVEIIEGWEWQDNGERPWQWVSEMYDIRQKLKAENNPSERAFKLGPNSLYGKVTQQVGWDKETFSPPRRFCLPLAAFITSFCRAQLWSMISQLPPQSIVAVETDSIITTYDPRQCKRFDEGIDIGQWEWDSYDEMIYIQSGVYVFKKDGKWQDNKAKTRGILKSAITHESMSAYLSTCEPNEQWNPIELPQGSRFIGIGASVNMAKNNPFKLNSLHCQWRPQSRLLIPGFHGKRIHIPIACRSCKEGKNANSSAHTLVVRSKALQEPYSAPYALTWEVEREKKEHPQWRIKDNLEREYIAEKD